MKRIAHRANVAEWAIEELKSKSCYGIELDVQFRRDGEPVVCHDKDAANQPDKMRLSTYLVPVKAPLYFFEIKPCLYKVEYTGRLFEVLYPHMDRCYVISFSKDIVNRMEVYGFRTAHIETVPGLGYQMKLPDGLRASTFDQSADYYIA